MDHYLKDRMQGLCQREEFFFSKDNPYEQMIAFLISISIMLIPIKEILLW